MSSSCLVRRLSAVAVVISLAVPVFAGNFAGVLKKYENREVHVRVSGAAKWTTETLREVGTDYIMLQSAESKRYVPLSSIIDVRVITLSSRVEVQVTIR